MRVVGATAIALAASMVIQSACRRGRPPRDLIEEVLVRHAQNRPVVMIAVGLEALNLPLLLGFVTGPTGSSGVAGVRADWSRLAGGRGRRPLGGLRALRRSVDRVVLSAGELAEPSPAFELVWQLHAAAFALALPALGTTFIGAALAAHERLTPPWQRLLGGRGRPAARRRAASLGDRDWLGASFVGCPASAAWLKAAGDRRTAGARSNSRDRPEQRIDLRRGMMGTEIKAAATAAALGAFAGVLGEAPVGTGTAIERRSTPGAGAGSAGAATTRATSSAATACPPWCSWPRSKTAARSRRRRPGGRGLGASRRLLRHDGEPYVVRLVFGLRQLRHGIPGRDLAGGGGRRQGRH